MWMYLPSPFCDVITLLFDTRFQFCFHCQIWFDVLYTFCNMFCTFNEFLGTPKKRDVIYPTTLKSYLFLVLSRVPLNHYFESKVWETSLTSLDFSDFSSQRSNFENNLIVLTSHWLLFDVISRAISLRLWHQNGRFDHFTMHKEWYSVVFFSILWGK